MAVGCFHIFSFYFLFICGEAWLKATSGVLLSFDVKLQKLGLLPVELGSMVITTVIEYNWLSCRVCAVCCVCYIFSASQQHSEY